MQMVGRNSFKSMVKMRFRMLALTAMSVGIALLQACSNSNPHFAPSTTTNPAPGVTLQAIKITPSTSLISLAENRQLTATAIYSDGSMADVTPQVKWSAASAPSTTADVAINSSGNATAMTLGSAVITATLGQVVGLLQLVVDSNGYTSNTLAILPVPFQSTFVDAAYLPQSQSKIQGAYAVQEVNLDADQFSSVLPVPAALLASIPMPAGFVPNITVASPSSSLVAVISYSSPKVQIIDASNFPTDVASNTVIATFTAPVSKTATFNGLACMICAAVVNPMNNQLLLSTAQGYYSMDLTAGTFTALPFSGALPAPSFALNPIAASPYIISSTFGQNPPSAGEVQVLDLTTNAVTTNTSLGLTNPYAVVLDLSNDFAAIVDAAAGDQALLNVTDPNNPTVELLSNIGSCTATAPLSMAALGIAANANPSSVFPSLFLSQPSGSCFGFEVWNPSDNNPLDFLQIPYGYAVMPSTPDGKAFANGSDPSTIASFNSVVDKKNYAVLVDANQNWIAKINPQVPLSLTSLGSLPAGFLIPTPDFGAGATGDAVIYLPTPASVVTLSQGTINFVNEPVGTQSAPSLVTLTNVGANPLIISQIAIQGSDSGDFSETDTCGASPTLAPQAKCVIDVFFTPTATGQRSATLSITDNGGASPQTVTLSGTGS